MYLDNIYELTVEYLNDSIYIFKLFIKFEIQLENITFWYKPPFFKETSKHRIIIHCIYNLDLLSLTLAL